MTTFGKRAQGCLPDSVSVSSDASVIHVIRLSENLSHCQPLGSSSTILPTTEIMAGPSGKARFYLEQSTAELNELERKKIFTRVCLSSPDVPPLQHC